MSIQTLDLAKKKKKVTSRAPVNSKALGEMQTSTKAQHFLCCAAFHKLQLPAEFH